MIFLKSSFTVILLVQLSIFFTSPSAIAASQIQDDAIAGLASHRAIYDIDLIATHSGSQILNISGKMDYQWKSSCDAWITDHNFKLFYEYADAPGMRLVSNFSTFETINGDKVYFSSRRQRDGSLYQEIRGVADITNKGGQAIYSMPEKIKFDLAAGMLFPTSHTVELVHHALKGDKFFNAQVFDGSDEDGPIEINAVVLGDSKPPESLMRNDKVDAGLLKGRAWKVRMAVFPAKDKEEASDYEMTMIFHENGIISDMTIDYDGFSVHQKLLALERVTPETCGNIPQLPKKP